MSTLRTLQSQYGSTFHTPHIYTHTNVNTVPAQRSPKICFKYWGFFFFLLKTDMTNGWFYRDPIYVNPWMCTAHHKKTMVGHLLKALREHRSNFSRWCAKSFSCFKVKLHSPEKNIINKQTQHIKWHHKAHLMWSRIYKLIQDRDVLLSNVVCGVKSEETFCVFPQDKKKGSNNVVICPYKNTKPLNLYGEICLIIKIFNNTT